MGVEWRARLVSFLYQLAGFAVVLLALAAVNVAERSHRGYVIVLVALPAIGCFWVLRLAVEPFDFSPYGKTEAVLERVARRPRYWQVAAGLGTGAVFTVAVGQPLAGGLLAVVPAIMTGVGVGSLLFLPRQRLGVPQLAWSVRDVPWPAIAVGLGASFVASVVLAVVLALPPLARAALLVNGAALLVAALATWRRAQRNAPPHDGATDGRAP